MCSNLKRWLRYARPYALYFVVGPLCMIVEVIGEIVLPKLYANIVNVGIETGNVRYIVVTCLLMILMALLMMTGGVGGAYFASKASVNVAADVRRDVYAKIQKFSFANIDRFSTGSLITRLTNDVTQVMNMINMLMRMCLRAPGMLIGALIAAISMSPSLATVLAVTVPLIVVVQFIVIRIGFPRFTRMQDKVDGLNNKIQEDLTNERVIKSFVREDYENRRFSAANADLKSTTLKALRVVIFMMPLMMLLMNLTSLAVVWFGGKMVIGGRMQVGDLTAFITYITQILMSLMMLTMIFMNSSRALASARRISEVLDEKIDLNDNQAKHKELDVRRGDVAAAYSLRRGAAEALEIVAHGDRRSSKVVGRRIGSISLPEGCAIGALIRGNDENALVLMGDKDTVIEAEDHVIVFVPSKKLIPKIERLFTVNVGFF